MSDHNHVDHGAGDKLTHGAGHEMDVPPTKELFNIIWGLGALTLLSLATCVQLFNNQQQDILTERAKESSSVLVQYRQGMDALTKSAGEVSFKDSTGAEVKQRYVPLAVARELVLSKPERLLAAPAPAGWMHPDDIAAGGQAGGAAPAAVPAAVPGAIAPPGTLPTDAPAGTPADPAAGAPAGTPAVGTPAGSVPVAAPPAGTVAPAGAGTGPDAKAATPPAPAPATPATTPATAPGTPAADPGKSGAATTPAPAPAH